ncbi:ROK family protein [Coriobacterium glomerans PW2]|uniref:ROK family protein n=1 Tax=Coriobacterium glomerans (strain ATCC 49209 / DSM 20642 / JCM 10262 / PW2) TaxID=700015 RepID=F2NBA7_CORGP|nr:ROK family protein [Coriobacterium glomerans]AEB06643.1 ROK family protein [Coriobacterium glomerans PW2]
MSLAVIDIGGTSVKFALYRHEGDATGLCCRAAVPTPSDLSAFYAVVEDAVAQMRRIADIEGVAISSPGAVDQDEGRIGGASAVPYIHGFQIVEELERRLAAPVAIENDANCAALAESLSGAARDVKDAVFLILGTGVGGAVVIDGKVHRGRHLLAGEFGFILQASGRTVSDAGTIVNAAKRFNAARGTVCSGKELFELAHSGVAGIECEQARAEVDAMCHVLATTIFNLQYSIDPDCFVIGGGISQNPALLPDLERALDDVMARVAIARVRPDIRIAKHQAEANLLGAVFNFEQQMRRGRKP